MLALVFLLLTPLCVVSGKPGPSGGGPPASATTVTLDYGTFVGFRDSNSGSIQYLGIPYADPPIGALRWKAPVFPPSRHLGQVNATKFGNACISTTQTTVAPGTSEDCLFGNVYIPTSQKSNSMLPVVVWLHGGGFQAGDTHSPAPDPILQSTSQSVIFVSFEYRLGQFGFLGGPQVKAQGALNAGLLDQRAALRWVQRYISNFGGDSQRVTIWGQSAGAGSAMFHLLGNGGNNEGLFRAAMGDSPSLGYMPSYTDAYVQDIFDQFSVLAGCNRSTNPDVMSCLRSANSSILTLAGSQTIATRISTLFTFSPIIDETFLSERPVEAFRSGHFAHVPVLFGSNANEGARWSSFLSDASANTSMPNATQTTVYNFIRGQYASFTKTSFDKAVSEFYPLSDYGGSFSLQGQQMYGEMRYICTGAMVAGAMSNNRLIADAASQGGQKGYHYHYDNPHLGSWHGEELDAFFAISVPANNDDKLLFTVMKDFWTSFIASEQPSTGDNSSAPWKPVSTADGSPHILLQPGSIVLKDITSAMSARCTFWHGLAEELKT